MKRIQSVVSWVVVIVVFSSLAIISARPQPQTASPRRIAIFGSSVANGTGDEFGKEGYTGLLKAFFGPRGWEVVNVARGGDTTKTIATRFAPEGEPAEKTRYLLPTHPGYVVIALSLANEGIWEAKTKEDKDAIFKQYADGIQGFIRRARENNIIPIVALCYPRMVYAPVDYEYVKRMNILQNSWDVPSVNFLGSTDDGGGHYASGFDFDDKHPNASGHREFFYAFVPSLFEALEKGKPSPQRIDPGKGFMRIISSGFAPLSFATRDTIHSFAFSFSIRANSNGTIAGISGSTLSSNTETKHAGTRGQTQFQSTTLSPDRVPSTAMIDIREGHLSYVSARGATISSSARPDGQWHQIVLSHYAARGETLFYVDGALAGKVSEHFAPSAFTLGGSGVDHQGQPGPTPADYRELFVFRSALDADEVAALYEGKMLQASLEVYSPLADPQFHINSAVENRAQSLSAFTATLGRFVHVADSGKP